MQIMISLQLQVSTVKVMAKIQTVAQPRPLHPFRTPQPMREQEIGIQLGIQMLLPAASMMVNHQIT
jgi:hypothetical protein